jgi:hypothetical protein
MEPAMEEGSKPVANLAKTKKEKKKRRRRRKK